MCIFAILYCAFYGSVLCSLFVIPTCHHWYWLVVNNWLEQRNNMISRWRFFCILYLFVRRMASPPKNTSSPSGHLSFLLVKPEPLATSSPLSTAVTSADLACTGEETWRAESFLQVIRGLVVCGVIHSSPYLFCLKFFFVVWSWRCKFKINLLNFIEHELGRYVHNSST